LFDCIECGACSWVCPSHIPLVQYYRASKAEILHAREEHKKAEQSRVRFEARQARLQREEAEKSAKRAARKQAAEQRARDASATSQVVEDDPVAAAINRAKAKKAAQQTMVSGDVSQKQRLENDVAAITQRLEKANQKLRQAEAERSEHLEALRAGVEKTRTKLETAQQALAALNSDDFDETETAPSADAAATAIAKAMAARTAKPKLDPAEQAREKLRTLEQRLHKTRERLAQGHNEHAEEKVISALEATILRLQDKIAETKADISTAEAE
ncbi:MAG: electron transport complex subunit RsxC, partial [Pseudomonadota bacterium]